MPSTRTFVSLPLPPLVRSAIAELIARQRGRAGPAWRWSDAASAHLTLAFLGDVEDEALASVRAATERAALSTAPFEAQLREAGAFPSPSRARVMWLGWGAGAESVRALQGLLAQELRARGFALERRPFRPHVTLARARSPGDARPLLEGLRGWSSEPWLVAEVDVMASRLTAAGAIHTLLERFALAPP